MQKVCIVVPNWNGKRSLPDCLDSLLGQVMPADIIVVDNGSTDGSLELLADKYHRVEVLALGKNIGFAGGVNAGIKRAMVLGARYVALFNNDAIADKKWLQNLVEHLSANPKVGIVTSKIISSANDVLDSTGEFYTSWGLPYPRGRGEKVSDTYDNHRRVFGASGAASLYRIKMLKEIGLFDEDFFAYYEDVDISFRAQLAGWKISYEPRAIVHHDIGGTSGKIKDFTTYQTMKNLPWLLWKNVPRGLLLTVVPRFELAYWGIYFSAIRRGQGWPATKGVAVSVALMPKKIWQRRKIQKRRKVSDSYVRSILVHDLPPNAHRLRALRAKWWRLTRRGA